MRAARIGTAVTQTRRRAKAARLAQTVQSPPADPARPVVAALMQVGPGVAPSSSLRPTLFSESQPLF